MVSNPKESIVRNEVEARQGSTRPKVIYVLVAALVLVIAVFLIIALATHR